MFGRRSLLVLLTFAFLAVSANGQAKIIRIVVEPSAESTFRIGLTFAGERSGVTRISLPNEWGGQTELYRSIRNLKAMPADARINETGLHTRTISHRPGEKITLTFEIVQDFAGSLKNSVRYRPVPDKSYIHWIGHTVWALPEWEDSTELKVDLEWKGFPKDWTFANSFGSAKRKQSFQTDLGSLRSSIFVAGDFRLAKTMAAGKPVNLAIRGTWNFSDAELRAMVRKVVETERNFFNDHSQKYYLVTLVPLDEGPNASSFGGTGLTDSFALFATPNAAIEQIRGLLAHEYAHNWIPAKLGRMPDPEQQLYWFSEGFTEYYTYRLLRLGDLISEQEFIAANNDRIREYYMLPVRGATNERIVKDFWSDSNVQRLPYLRGFLFATNLNAEIIKASMGKLSLDDAMQELFNAAKIRSRPLSFEALAALFTKYLGADATPVMKRFLVDGELIEPDPAALGKMVTLETVEMPIFELGFNVDKFAREGIVSGVDPNSAAYAAGLRDGQQRTGGFSLTFGDTSREILLKVKDASGEKTVRFLPVAKGPAAIPQYKRRG